MPLNSKSARTPPSSQPLVSFGRTGSRVEASAEHGAYSPGCSAGAQCAARRLLRLFCPKLQRCPADPSWILITVERSDMYPARGRGGTRSECLCVIQQFSYQFARAGKYDAHLAVQRAMKAGQLEKQGCEVCGTEAVDAHHDQYDEPLSVRWLCRRHHTRLHHYGEDMFPIRNEL